MSETAKLTAADGHQFDAYVARPDGKPKAALVVVQEIFGVNEHIRSVADNYAKEGYLAVAPAIFDRYERGVNLDYSAEGWKKAMSFMPALKPQWAVDDTAAAAAYAREQSGAKVGVVGYCLGGSVAWVSAATLPIDAAVGYYGGMIAKFLDQAPKCPIMLHFGAKDEHIPTKDIEAVKQAYPDVPVYVYETAGHAFNRSPDPTAYDAPSAELALERTLAFFAEHLA